MKMRILNELSPQCIVAEYQSSLVPHFAGNPLIETLRQPLSPDKWLRVFSHTPVLTAEQRNSPIELRFQMLKQLNRFMVPLQRHVALAMELDALLLNGYVGRAPETPAHVQRLQSIYEDQLFCREEDPFVDEDMTTQQAKLLMGISGMGKTRFIKRWAGTLPRVIYHSALNRYQIPCLHVELPSNGASVTGLCHAIFQTVDKLVPMANYMQTYALKGKPSTETLIQRAASVLHRHCVGILFCDEFQNLTNVGKGKQTVMTELVTMSNVLGLPLVFIGTNKSEELLGLDFRTSRRVSGLGTEHWDRLDPGYFDDEGRFVSEWRDFLDVLWEFQWTRNPTPLSEEAAETMYYCSQGVLDVAIKLFASAQAHAMLDGSETVTTALVMHAYRQELTLLHPMLDALRNNDHKTLASYPDIRPVGLVTMLSQLQRRAASKVSRAFTVKPDTPGFTAQVATALAATGFDAAEAVEAAKAVVEEGKARNLLEATKEGTRKLQPPTKVSGGKARRATTAPEPLPDYSHRPADLRNALQQARQTGRKVLEELHALGFARPFDAVLAVT